MKGRRSYDKSDKVNYINETSVMEKSLAGVTDNEMMGTEQ